MCQGNNLTWGQRYKIRDRYANCTFWRVDHILKVSISVQQTCTVTKNQDPRSTESDGKTAWQDPGSLGSYELAWMPYPRSKGSKNKTVCDDPRSVGSHYKLSAQDLESTGSFDRLPFRIQDPGFRRILDPGSSLDFGTCLAFNHCGCGTTENNFLRWVYLTWAGDLTWGDLWTHQGRFAHNVRNGWPTGRYAKLSGAFFRYRWKTTGVEISPRSARVEDIWSTITIQYWFGQNCN